MAKRKIIWSKRAEAELKSILEFYTQRNQSIEYSLSILEDIERYTELLKDFPELGRLSKNKKSRILVIKEFLLIYDVAQNIEVLSFWDNRQDPNKRVHS